MMTRLRLFVAVFSLFATVVSARKATTQCTFVFKVSYRALDSSYERASIHFCRSSSLGAIVVALKLGAASSAHPAYPAHVSLSSAARTPILLIPPQCASPPRLCGQLMQSRQIRLC